MSKNIWSKSLLAVAVVLWALYALYPLQGSPFAEYIQSRPTAHQEEFADFIDQAQALVDEGSESSFFLALQSIGRSQDINYARFFPDLKLADIRSVSQRNEVLLNYLLQESQGKLKQGLDLQGGVAFTLAVDKASSDSFEKASQLEKAIDIMGKRINGLGVAEPMIRAKGHNHIEVQLPGLSTEDNPDTVAALKRPAKLEFRFVHPDPYLIPGAVPVADYPAGYEVMEQTAFDSKTGEPFARSYFVQKLPALTGKAISNAYVSMTALGGYQVSLTFVPSGAERFAQITRDNIGRQLGIVLDGHLYSAPVIRSEIPTGQASIDGDFTQRDALELVNVLNNPLEFELTLEEMYEVGPTLASDAREASMRAAMLGAGLVVVFMVAYYWASGLIAVFSVLLNVVIVLGVLASIQATMTLPGIAALVVTMGMGVDANILIFERIREELRAGKSTQAALNFGFEKALSTIIDANLTTLLAAGILIGLGSGPIKGFGITLAIGIGASIFCALVISRVLMEFLVGIGCIKKIIPYSLFKELRFDFMRFGKKAFIAASILMLVSVGILVTQGKDSLGIDFLGGDELTLQYKKEVPLLLIDEVMQDNNLGAVTAYYSSGVVESESFLKVQAQSGAGKEVYQALSKAFSDHELKLLGETSIGASVSDTLAWNALWSVGAAMAGILIYVTFRFEMSYGLGAVVSTIYDVVASVGVYILLGGKFSAPMIAAVLMIIGYSINDTIVVFDRIREELKVHPTLSLYQIINTAISKTFSRTLLTSITTFIAAFALYVFGAGQIDDFALLFMIGIAMGTFSSVFIASPVLYWRHKGDRRAISAQAPQASWSDDQA